MNEFSWQDQYRIGDEKIDRQHRQLFDLANQLANSQTQQDMTENFMLLYKHVREHFQEEERFMKDLHYPEYQNHVNEHNLMLDKLVDVSAKINQPQWQQLNVAKFMSQWLTHIAEKDRAISEYVLADSLRQGSKS
ncbi:hemerythrin family protein [Methylomonas sp. LL1]|uniref:bacteriohemerythrin n=1 Tax=Methylomonas sp. LL1 TaxID=2785785 RepID=UPI0018C4417D|nr:hemerythrin family protein [Methylomonas sp. LL1]QPK63894.1 hemerythrin family protein [Methylomonas sp. LL1]CAG1020506.1 hypothetical protein MTYM_00321 [Methylococcales bacterium]